ncbi:unnamed protein product [Didymodactylos carnosus]|uniref:Uncharacterized protein n=1 Tax=Didymodactylos carnosus TaxID=1234261 RepID=A0A813NUH1_9BILA|nr:unnamed protein product [Didymodactylos carnosus]CAF0763573.1 unnamed protein product [Didymodactylos carnosus]CAF3517126.1 unnamed protein product [Didymodactylos carnosus]CAF3543540.1 unnamed protein product [Didymodactylos carnosus]
MCERSPIFFLEAKSIIIDLLTRSIEMLDLTINLVETFRTYALLLERNRNQNFFTMIDTIQCKISYDMRSDVRTIIQHLYRSCRFAKGNLRNLRAARLSSANDYIIVDDECLKTILYFNSRAATLWRFLQPVDDSMIQDQDVEKDEDESTTEQGYFATLPIQKRDTNKTRRTRIPHKLTNNRYSKYSVVTKPVFNYEPTDPLPQLSRTSQKRNQYCLSNARQSPKNSKSKKQAEFLISRDKPFKLRPVTKLRRVNSNQLNSLTACSHSRLRQQHLQLSQANQSVPFASSMKKLNTFEYTSDNVESSPKSITSSQLSRTESVNVSKKDQENSPIEDNKNNSATTSSSKNQYPTRELLVSKEKRVDCIKLGRDTLSAFTSYARKSTTNNITDQYRKFSQLNTQQLLTPIKHRQRQDKLKQSQLTYEWNSLENMERLLNVNNDKHLQDYREIFTVFAKMSELYNFLIEQLYGVRNLRDSLILQPVVISIVRLLLFIAKKLQNIANLVSSTSQTHYIIPSQNEIIESKNHEDIDIKKTTTSNENNSKSNDETTNTYQQSLSKQKNKNKHDTSSASKLSSSDRSLTEKLTNNNVSHISSIDVTTTATNEIEFDEEFYQVDNLIEK